MPIASINIQPATDSLTAAYRPILVRAIATRTDGIAVPPVVYCDIYFGGIFYKTLSKTQYTVRGGSNSEWEFDIQDAAQEYLKKALGANGATVLLQVPEIISTCFVKFRSSGFNVAGFIESENTPPVQGTSSTPPVSGTGTQSNTFFVLNATLQHEDNQDIASHLNAFKKRAWTSDAFPLTHRPDNYHVTPMDSDFFPIVYTGADRPASIVLNYRYRNQSTWRTSGPSTFASFTPAKSVFYIPDGPANLHPLFAPNFGDIAEYYLEVKDTTGAIIATTNIMTVNGCEDDYFRIHFLNRLGAIDAINFHVTDITQEVKSDTTERPTTTPLVKSQHAVRRFSVRSNDKHTGLNQEFHEEDLDFVDELFASPLHWLQWKGTQSQVDDYIPIVLSDQKNMKRKAEDRYSYDVTVEFTLSHEKFIIRN